jgi:hypothetical protein
MLRIPGTFNSKNSAQQQVQVKIIQKGDIITIRKKLQADLL